MLDLETLPYLKNKNLLAFSAGVDSTALFFLLMDNNIAFDIALVNYQTRSSSNKEEEYAYTLAKQYQKKIFTIKAPLIEQNFEKEARDFRYRFFENIIAKNGYDNLLTAHQLNDQLEWLFMRLARGAGVMELIGLESISKRQNYRIIRPILHHSKEQLIEFLDTHNHHYFIDDSNFDTRYERNYFRSAFANAFIEQYQEGVVRSFEYLKGDCDILQSTFSEMYRYKEFVILEYTHPKVVAKAIDMSLKSLGYLLSASQREAVIANHSLVIGGKWAIERKKHQIYIAPYRQSPMPKIYKELCRIHHIPSKIRPYLFDESILPYAVTK